MLKRIVICMIAATLIWACSSEEFPEQKKLIVNSLAAGEKMPEVYSARLYDGVIFMGSSVGWFVRDGEVLALDGQSRDLSPGIKSAPKSVIEAAYAAAWESKDLSKLKKNPITLPPHLSIKYDELYEKFMARMPENETRLSGNGDLYNVTYGHWKHLGDPGYFGKGRYTLEENAGWVTRLDVFVYHSRTPVKNDKPDMVPCVIIENIFEILEPGSSAELYGQLIRPLEELAVTQTEYRHGGFLYKSWSEEIENHPDDPGREIFHLAVVPEGSP